LLVTILFLLYRWRQNSFYIFSQLGLPGPQPNWWGGNIDQLRKEKLPFKVLQQWTKQYGKLYGYFEGSHPVIVSTDLDFLKGVFIKNFNSFHGRKPFAIQPHPDNEYASHMLFARGNRWKRLRAICNPAFASSKLKQLAPAMIAKVDILLDKLHSAVANEDSINIHECYQALTLDVIGETAFGIEVSAQKDPNNKTIQCCREAFEFMERHSFFFMITERFPSTQRSMWWIFLIYMIASTSTFSWLRRQIQSVVEERKHSGEKKLDLLQLMIDAEIDEGDQAQSVENNEFEDATTVDASCENAKRSGKKLRLAPTVSYVAFHTVSA